MNVFPNLLVIVVVDLHQRFVMRKGHRWKIFEQIVTVVYVKKQQILQENTCVRVSFCQSCRPDGTIFLKRDSSRDILPVKFAK